MNVAELIELLKQVPPDSNVETEGCDCYGPANGILIDSQGDVTIVRDVFDVQGYLSPPSTEVKKRPIPKPQKNLAQIERELGL